MKRSSSSLGARRATALGFALVGLAGLLAACSSGEGAPDDAATVAPDIMPEDSPQLLNESEALAAGDIDEPVVRDVDDSIADEIDAPEIDEEEALRVALLDAMPESEVKTRCGTEPLPAPAPPRGFDADAMASRAKPLVVPVVIHVLREGKRVSQGNVPSARLTKQIKVLNDSYGGRTKGARTIFQFKLVKVERITSKKWFRADARVAGGASDQMKKSLHDGGSRTLNLYTKQAGGNLLGIATYPWSRSGRLDGVIIDHGTVPGGSAQSYNLGDTATHEVGHWLGLHHTFDENQRSCAQSAGDGIGDTPAEKSPAFRCTPHRDTCPGQKGYDPVHNFMDYTTDGCMHQFTPGQAAVTAASFILYRML